MPDKKPLIERIKDSDFGQFVTNKVAPLLPKAAEIMADSGIPGVSLVGKIGQLISDSKEESHELKALDAEFRKFEMQWQLDMIKIENDHHLEVMKLDMQNLQSVHDREIKFMQQSGGKRDWIMGALAIVVMISWVFFSYVSVYHVVPGENREFFIEMRTASRDATMVLLTFYFGSSLSSKLKDKAILNKI